MGILGEIKRFVLGDDSPKKKPRKRRTVAKKSRVKASRKSSSSKASAKKSSRVTSHVKRAGVKKKATPQRSKSKDDVPVKLMSGIRYSRAQTIKVGQYRKGEITRIKRYGVFVELDSGDSGLVHINDLSWKRCVVENVAENGDADIAGFSVGDNVRVKVLNVTEEGKIALGIKQTQCHPFDIQKAKIKKLVGNLVDGEVESIKEFGVLVKLLPGVTGLIPKRESQKFGRMTDGQVVSVYVDSVDWEKKHILLLKEKRQTENTCHKNGEVRRRKPDAVVVAKKCLVCIDGSNVISAVEQLRTLTLKKLVEALSANGYRYMVFVDKSIFGWLTKNKFNNDLAYLRDMESRGEVIVAPNKAEADGQLLQLAEYEKDSHVISNDQYRDYGKLHPWVKTGSRVHGFNIVPLKKGTHRVLVAGFNLDIVVSEKKKKQGEGCHVKSSTQVRLHHIPQAAREGVDQKPTQTGTPRRAMTGSARRPFS